MTQFVCDKCGFVSQDNDGSDTCPNCGIAAVNIQALKQRGLLARDSVEGLFDLGPADPPEPVAGPAARLRPSAPPLQAADSAVELSDADLLAVATPPTPPPARPLTAGLLKSSTLEIEEGDLEEVPAPPRARDPRAGGEAPGATGNGAGSSAPRSLRGRVAVPLPRVDQTPLPSTLPPGADELAIAGQPPRPHQQERRLRGQTEQLSAIRARQQKKLLVPLATAALLLLVAAGLYQLWPGQDNQLAGVTLRPAELTQARSEPLLAPDAGALSRTLPVDATEPLRQDAAKPAAGEAPRGAAASRKQPVSPGGARSAERPPAGEARRIEATARPALVKASASELTKPAASPAQSQEAAALAAPAGLQARELYRQGIQLLLRGEAQQAVDRFNQALRLDAKFSLAYRGLGLAYEKLGSQAMARASFEQYLQANAGAADAEAIRQRLQRLP